MPVELTSMILTTLLATATVPAAAPEPELLEFLGGFETADGKWLDPQLLDDKVDDAPPPGHEEDRS